MARHTHDTTDKTVSSQAEPAPTPLVSAEGIPIESHPTVRIPEERLYALKEQADHIADTWSGTTDNHRTGLLGEDAVARYLGIEDSLNVEVYADGGDGGVDLEYYGATIDVKTVGQHRTDPSLTVDAYESLTADYYVLASRIGAVDFRLIGYVPRWFVANAPVRSYQGEQYHIVDQRYLFPLPRR
jgi:hypothetical protein